MQWKRGMEPKEPRAGVEVLPEERRRRFQEEIEEQKLPELRGLVEKLEGQRSATIEGLMHGALHPRDLPPDIRKNIMSVRLTYDEKIDLVRDKIRDLGGTEEEEEVLEEEEAA